MKNRILLAIALLALALTAALVAVANTRAAAAAARPVQPFRADGLYSCFLYGATTGPTTVHVQAVLGAAWIQVAEPVNTLVMEIPAGGYINMAYLVACEDMGMQ